LTTIDEETTDRDLRQVTRAELVWLWRRRQPTALGHTRGRNGARMTANEAASALGFRPEVYCAVERGGSPYEDAVLAAVMRERGSWLAQPTVAELCVLARRRAAAGVPELCSALGGVSKPNFYDMERRGEPSLVALWRERGFEFP
jgi:hypothetical protein